MVIVRCFCAFHAVRMGVLCEWFECTYSDHAFKVVRMVVIRLYIGVFCGWFECTNSRCARLRLYVLLSFACMSVMEA